MELLRACGGLLLGFFLPGYLLARLLRSPWRVVPAFPASLAVLFLVVLGAELAGLPLRFATLAPLLALVSAGLALAVRQREAGAPLAPQSPRPRDGLVLAIGAAFTLLLAVRAWNSPLAGADTLFRWEFLALQMRRFATFSFYPPLSPADFARYFYVDGIPPMVSFGYYWLYECVASDDRRFTTLLVAAQYAAALAATGRLGSLVAGASGARVALLALVSSPLVFWAFLQGQETGLITLSLATAAALLLDARGGPGRLVLAAVVISVAGLSREYGPAFVLVAALVALQDGLRGREALRFAAAALVLSLPWYLRSAALTGNPVYSNPLGSLPVNPVHLGLLRTYAAAARHEIAGDPAGAGLVALRALVPSAPAPLLLGMLAAAALARRVPLLLAALGTCIALWACSVPWTAGGLGPTLRVLAPAALLASLLVARAAARVRLPPPLAAGLVTLAVGYGALASAFVPFRPGDDLRQVLGFRPQQAFEDQAQFVSQVLGHAPGRVLTDNAYLHAALSGSGRDVAPVWSPEFAFLFDARRTASDAARELREHGVGFVVLKPGTFNASYLLGFPFFAEQLGRADPLAEADGWRVYEVAAGR